MTIELKAQRTRRRSPALNRDSVDLVCHELRRPLAVIQAYAELLEDQIAGPLNPEQRQQAEIITSSSRSLARLLADLQESFEVLTGNVDIQLGEHDLETLLLALAAEYDDTVASRNLRLSILTDGPLIHPSIDARLLSSALRRAIDNALLFGDTGGEIQVEMRRMQRGARITISDAGPGIPATHLEQVFDCFTRGAPPPGSAAKGIGLGLPVCRAILGLFGGTARAEIRNPCGLTLVLHLPISTRRSDESPRADDEPTVRFDPTDARAP